MKQDTMPRMTAPYSLAPVVVALALMVSGCAPSTSSCTMRGSRVRYRTLGRCA